MSVGVRKCMWTVPACRGVEPSPEPWRRNAGFRIRGWGREEPRSDAPWRAIRGRKGGALAARGEHQWWPNKHRNIVGNQHQKGCQAASGKVAIIAPFARVRGNALLLGGIGRWARRPSQLTCSKLASFSRMASNRMGLLRKSSMPASRQRWRSLSKALAVSAMMWG